MIGRRRRQWMRTAVALGWALPTAAAGQEAPPVDIGALLRIGTLAHADSALGPDGFRLFEARLEASGKVGIIFDYHVQTRYDPEKDALTLHDAIVTIPMLPELALDLGLQRPSFGLEATLEPRRTHFPRAFPSLDGDRPRAAGRSWEQAGARSTVGSPTVRGSSTATAAPWRTTVTTTCSRAMCG